MTCCTVLLYLQLYGCCMCCIELQFAKNVTSMIWLHVLHPIMIFSITYAMTMHYGSGPLSYARKCQRGSHMCKRRQNVLVIWLMPSKDYKLTNHFLASNGIMYFSITLFFRSIHAWFWLTREANEECFRAWGLVNVFLGSSPFSLRW